MAYETYAAGDLVFFNTEAAGPGGYFTQLARTLTFGEPTDEIKKATMIFNVFELESIN
jgi:Xaa-Pro aminopeptidase